MNKMFELIGIIISCIFGIIAFVLGLACVLAPFAIPAFLIYKLVKSSGNKKNKNTNPYDRGTIKY